MEGTQGVIDRIAELEDGNARIISVTAVGDKHLIVYENKPRMGRPPKAEERGTTTKRNSDGDFVEKTVY
jgi:hypothetical protein